MQDWADLRLRLIKVVIVNIPTSEYVISYLPCTLSRVSKDILNGGGKICGIYQAHH